MDRRKYLAHFMILFSGTAAAQLVNLASYPFLARLYTPADFGVFAMFVAVAAVPGAIACGRFDLAVPIAPHFGRHAVLWLCIAISSAIGLLSTAGATLYWHIASPGMSYVMPLLIGLCVFLTGFTAASSLYLMRHDMYRVSSASLLVRTGATVLVQIGLAFLWRTPLSLVLGFMTGFAAQAAMLGWAIWAHIPPKGVRWPHMRAMFRRYRRQVSVDIPSTFIAAISLNLMTYLLSIRYGQRTVGFYSLGNRMAIMPLQLFNDALSQVFFQKAARSQEQNGHFWNEMKFNLLTSTLLSGGVLVGIWLFARPFITLYLGPDWAPAADILMILAPMLAVRSTCMSIATAVFVLNRPQWLLGHNIANVLTLALSFAIAEFAGLSLLAFLYLASAMLMFEYGLFAALLVWASRPKRSRHDVSASRTARACPAPGSPATNNGASRDHRREASDQ